MESSLVWFPQILLISFLIAERSGKNVGEFHGVEPFGNILVAPWTFSERRVAGESAVRACPGSLLGLIARLLFGSFVKVGLSG